MTDEAYTLREVYNHQDVIALTKLLRESGRLEAEPLGACIRSRPDRLALASRGEVFLIPLDDKLVQAALTASVVGGNPPRLVVRDAEVFLVRATKYMTEHADLDGFRRLADQVVGDLEECGHCIDQPVLPARAFKSLADDAYDARVLEPSYSYEAPKFYYSISLPWTRLRAEYRLFGEKQVGWWLTYPDLWLRVLAYMTSDPTLVWAFNQQRDPIETVATLIKTPPEIVEPLLIWQALGRTVQVMAEVFPGSADALPDNLPEWGRKLDRALPSLVGNISNMMHTYQERRTATTLYGRKMRGGRHPAYAPYFTIWGTVEDILRVAAVTFWQNGRSRGIFIGDVDMEPLARLNRVRGTAPTLTDMNEWLYNMNRLAFLGEPLRSQPKLDPTFVIAEK